MKPIDCFGALVWMLGSRTKCIVKCMLSTSLAADGPDVPGRPPGPLDDGPRHRGLLPLQPHQGGPHRLQVSQGYSFIKVAILIQYNLM